ncbi:hypothetical protein RHMOL_Rhmol11G0178000 [Rhododendron molle]|uniref:Uncharacterized protein n=1 Tax=Rhododendron molle TaxID=49168 RepID=A0ACC0LV50_RHOML|nr:hypothetical protein RHMOL_Rhmol11G0178000 [Rhododendron molle]
MNVDFLELFQAVFKQFGAGGNGLDNVVPDEAELQHHQKLEKLYISRRAAKVIETLCQFQRDIVRGVEGYIVTGSKQVEIGTKLSEDCRKYGSENTCTSGSTLSKATSSFGRARAQMEKEHGNLLKSLGTQVAEPLRAMVMGAPLEDARHLAQRYDRVRQEAESQVFHLRHFTTLLGYTVFSSYSILWLLKFPYVKQNSKKTGNPDVALKLEASETKQQDLKSNMGILGKDAAAMSAVEAQQQRLTLQQLIAMMISERQRIEAPLSPIMDSMPLPPSYEEVNGVFASPTPNGSTDSMGYFLGEVMYSYQAESDVELNLSIVLQLFMFHGFDRGQTMAGPNANARGKPVGFHLGTYVERRERVLASKVAALR